MWFLFFRTNYIENPHQNENKLIKTEVELCTHTWWKFSQILTKLKADDFLHFLEFKL